MVDDIQQEEEAVTVFAKTTFRNKMKTFGIKVDDRRRHVYAIGKTGMGKTVLLENLIYSDIMNGNGCCYVDPHGDTAERLLNCIPSSRINDVIYFNPADTEYPISFNILEKVDPNNRHLVASGLIGVFKKLWADSWGPRLEYILRNAILALLDYPDSTLLGINRMLVDKAYNKKVVDKITDPVVKTFWIDEYPKWSDRVLQEVISPIQNKVGQFLSTSLIRNIVGQVRSSLDLRKVMDEKKILILNLSKGRIGEDAMALLGSMMITKIQLAAMSRVDIPEEERNDFYMYVDELHNFVTESFADILSEARKYRLCLTLAHQYIEQLGEVVGPAVFGNVGTIINFRVGAADAEFLVKEYDPFLTEQNLVSLPKFHFYLKLMINGITSDPFSAIGLPPLINPQGFDDKIITVSRERYSKPRDVVEDKIRRWHETAGGEDKDGRSDKSKSSDKDQEGDFDAVCDGCDKKIKTKFQPDGVRATYCSDCLKRMRKGELPSLKPKSKQKPGTPSFSGPNIQGGGSGIQPPATSSQPPATSLQPPSTPSQPPSQLTSQGDSKQAKEFEKREAPEDKPQFKIDLPKLSFEKDDQSSQAGATTDKAVIEPVKKETGKKEEPEEDIEPDKKSFSIKDIIKNRSENISGRGDRRETVEDSASAVPASTLSKKSIQAERNKPDKVKRIVANKVDYAAEFKKIAERKKIQEEKLKPQESKLSIQEDNIEIPRKRSVAFKIDEPVKEGVEEEVQEDQLMITKKRGFSLTQTLDEQPPIQVKTSKSVNFLSKQEDDNHLSPKALAGEDKKELKPGDVVEL